jgi:signal transduction histidine kinase/ActR/RegA family two-component response regulator
VEHRFRGVDGKWHPILARGVPVRNERGEITAWAGINLDISRLKQVEQELRDADRRKDEFLAVLAHELRNPLAPIRTGLELMRLAGDDPAAIEDVRATMERQSQQMVRLIDDLLDVSRITRGTVELRKSRVELRTVIANAVDAARPVIEEMGHELKIVVPKQPIVLDADAARLAQVISNLLNNAAKYMDRGGQIQLTADRLQSTATVSVKDSGIGIPAEMIDRIFDLFTQVDGSLDRSHGGLGIGLTLVKRLVEMHGGSVEVRSAGIDQGSEFIVRLPAVVDLLSDEPAQPGVDTPTITNKRRILVVDDNEMAANVLAMLLKALGNDVRTAFDGLSALALAEQFRPDIILLDLGMPKLNGYETARRIREQSWGQNIILAALTGWGQDEDRRRTRDAGFDHHFVKPLEPNVLQKLLAEHEPPVR